MANPITVPRLGWNMDKGVFVGWLKADGAPVRAGEALFTLEGDKTTEDVEGLEEGVLHVPANGPRAGDVVTVGTVIGYLLQPGEPVPVAKPATSPTSAARESGPGPATVIRPTSRRRPASSPRARRVAVELGIDLADLQGTGRTGRIRERDVRMAAGKVQAPDVPAVSPIRRTIAERMMTSQRSTAPVTLTTTTDATELVNLRNQFKTASQVDQSVVPSYTDVLVKLTAAALRKHPLLNARWDGERIVSSEKIDVGIAVDTDAGLLVPVLRDVPSLTLKQLSIRARDLIERARLGKLSATDLQGGTFTVTNLGAFGVDVFTPIVNYPECAVLGVGRIQRRPVVVGEQIVAREQLTLNLTFDHRIVDGAPAAKFLQMLCGLIENPGPWLTA
jgi:pyruvate dehydrogenase E2 component (dihydrolipoamide acetyltransferase)